MALSGKQKAFIDHYLQCGFNATEAARRAGYKGNDVTLAAVGYENLRKHQIAEAIQRRVDERVMTANEALILLAEHARGDIGDYVTDEGEIDIGAMKQAKATRLLRKVRHTRRGGTNKDGGEWESVTVEAELYSAQAALELIGKTHKLFTDRVEHAGEIVITVKYDDDGIDSPPTDTPSETT